MHPSLRHNAFTEAEVALLPLTVAPAAAEQSTLSQVQCILFLLKHTASLQSCCDSSVVDTRIEHADCTQQ
jgi:hypothetical protein